MTAYGLWVALGAAAALVMAAALWKKEEEALPLANAALGAILGGFVGARLLYVLFRLGFYLEFGLWHALMVREGGFLLYGALLGAGIGIWLAGPDRRTWCHTMDLLAAPAMVMIAICRLAERTCSEGLGNWVEQGLLAQFPFAVQNEFGEMQLAVFRMEALCAVLIAFIVLRHPVKGRAALSLALYAACQVILESLRMDSSLKIGFVRVSQVLSGICLLLLSLRQGRTPQERLKRGTGVLILCGGVGGLEWALEKTWIGNGLIYLCMCVLCIGLFLLAAGTKRVNNRVKSV